MPQTLLQVSFEKNYTNRELLILYYQILVYYKNCRWRTRDWRPSEGIRPIAWIYILLSMLCMLAAVYYFTEELKSSARSPAGSRGLNKPCAVLIFDNHDLWHFLSAGGEWKLLENYRHLNLFCRAVLSFHVHSNIRRLQQSTTKNKNSSFLKAEKCIFFSVLNYFYIFIWSAVCEK